MSDSSLTGHACPGVGILFTKEDTLLPLHIVEPPRLSLYIVMKFGPEWFRCEVMNSSDATEVPVVAD